MKFNNAFKRRNKKSTRTTHIRAEIILSFMCGHSNSRLAIHSAKDIRKIIYKIFYNIFFYTHHISGVKSTI